jgi:hypothetical protein
MIGCLHALLVELGCIAAGPRCPSNISFRRPNFIQFFPDSKQSIVIKTAPAQSTTAEALEREYETLKYLARRHAYLIAAPIAFELRHGNAFLVMEGVSHGPTSLSDLMRPLPASQKLGCFLAAVEMQDRARADMPPPLSLASAVIALPESIRQKVSAVATARDWRRWEEALPAAPQHSDLAINNVGRTPERFVLFDWEDYGRVTLPGFDFATLLVSACGFDARSVNATIESLVEKKRGAQGVFQYAVDLLPTERDRLLDIVLISLVLFHSLKCTLNYDDDVIAKCRALLSALIT